MHEYQPLVWLVGNLHILDEFRGKSLDSTICNAQKNDVLWNKIRWFLQLKSMSTVVTLGTGTGSHSRWNGRPCDVTHAGLGMWRTTGLSCINQYISSGVKIQRWLSSKIRHNLLRLMLRFMKLFLYRLIRVKAGIPVRILWHLYFSKQETW